MSKRDYYEILGVQRDAGEQDIKSAYRKLALKNHPDRNPGDAAAEDRFKEAAEAYGVLGDQEKRARYDRFGHAGVSGAGAAGVNPDIFTDFSDILGDFFGFGGGGGRRGGPMRGADLRFDLEITFQDSFAGSETTIQIPREESCETCKGSGAAPGTTKETCSQCNGRGEQRYQQGFMVVARTCSRCQGTGQIIRHPCMVCRGTGRTTKDRRVTVKIPAGISDGQQLRMYGEGEHGSAGGPSGDLYVVIHVAADAQFHRNGDDLYLEVPVPFYMMALGGSFKVDGPAGEITVHVSAGSADGTLVSFHGKGVPSVSGRGRGTLFVRLVVDVPKKMSKEHKKLIEQLGKLEPVEKLKARTAGAEQDKPFFEKVKDLFGEYPAIDLIWRVVPDDAHVERLLAEIDDEHPTAVEPRDGGVRVFFPTAAARDRAAPLLCSHDSSLTCTPLSVPDEDWAARSQASLGSVRVGRIVVTPPHAITPGWDDGAIGIVIQPSMGFGTGHHATTRRCLELMQQIDLSRASVLDVGTGSGILAIAGAKLGATRVIGVDHDPDALTAAAENVERNAVDVTLENIDLSESPLPDAFDLVVANLTGATLERFAAQLTSALAPNGHLIVSGLLTTEEAGVQTALESRGLRVVAKAHEEEWVALQLRRRSI